MRMISPISAASLRRRLQLRFRIDRVPEAVAEEVEGEDGDEDGHAGSEEPGIVLEVIGIARSVQHDAPTRVGFLDAYIEKAEDDFAEDIIWNAQSGGDDHIGKRIRQEVFGDDAQVALAE